MFINFEIIIDILKVFVCLKRNFQKKNVNYNSTYLNLVSYYIFTVILVIHVISRKSSSY